MSFEKTHFDLLSPYNILIQLMCLTRLHHLDSSRTFQARCCLTRSYEHELVCRLNIKHRNRLFLLNNAQTIGKTKRRCVWRFTNDDNNKIDWPLFSIYCIIFKRKSIGKVHRYILGNFYLA
uniref:Uncharacterized protein n=1 Tax=Cacopsylla melanoneura TaxID=428564 RepID=A0A8D8ZCK8_9HEMI